MLAAALLRVLPALRGGAPDLPPGRCTAGIASHLPGDQLGALRRHRGLPARYLALRYVEQHRPDDVSWLPPPHVVLGYLSVVLHMLLRQKVGGVVLLQRDASLVLLTPESSLDCIALPDSRSLYDFDPLLSEHPIYLARTHPCTNIENMRLTRASHSDPATNSPLQPLAVAEKPPFFKSACRASRRTRMLPPPHSGGCQTFPISA